MPPIHKLTKQKAPSQEKKQSVSCPYCGFHICWRHGSYRRKGFHRPVSSTGGCVFLETVLRYLCRAPTCRHTFSELPADILPYCRFYLSGLLSIAANRSEGTSAYRIAQHWGLSLRVISRAVKHIREATDWLAGLCREQVQGVVSGFGSLVSALSAQLGWFAFTQCWYRHFYPGRFGQIANPHKLGIKQA